MDLNTVFSDYWEVLNLYEDYLKGGYRTDHEPAPSFRFEIPAAETGPSPEPAHPAQAREGSLEERILTCRQCDLHLARKQAIPGRGPEHPRLLIVLPPPGYDEDEQCVPLTGDPSVFLDKWLTAVGVEKDAVYFTNAVKCRTPGTRPPFAGEVETCASFLAGQVEKLKPEAVLLLGETALSALAGISGQDAGDSLSERRGKPFFLNNVFFLATYDPASVLRDSAGLKRPAWEDLKILRDFLNHG